MVRYEAGPRADHRTRILHAASRLFLESGFELTSTARIAERAKVSKRELYAHFRDKRAILAAVITQLQEQAQSQVSLSWSSNDDIRRVLTRAGTEILDFVYSEKFGKLLRIVAAETFRDPVSSAKFYQLGPGAGRRDTAAFIRRQMSAGFLRKSDPLRAADDFLDLLISARHLTAVVLGQKDEVPKTRTQVNHAVEIFLGHYAPPAVPRTPGNNRRVQPLRAPRAVRLKR